jgi:hypothetical protein
MLMTRGTFYTTRIRKVLIYLILQPKDHFIHSLETLREEFLCVTYGQLLNLQLKLLFGAQTASLAREDEVRGEGNLDNLVNEFELRSLIPSSITDTDQYREGVKEKCFAVATKPGPPTFFLTFTMDPYWREYQSLKRGTGNFSDRSIAAIIFRVRLKGFMQFCKKSRVLGNVRAFVWRIEYQQRDLPHAHILC